MALFQLLHISDLHAAEEPRRVGWGERSHWNEFPSAVRRRLKAASWDPDLAGVLANQVIQESLPHLDAILLTGDVAATGDPKDFEETRSGFLHRVQQLFVAQPKRPELIILPGNHDRFRPKLRRRTAYGANNPSFDEIFRSEWTQDAIQALDPMSSRPAVHVQILRRADNSKLAVVSADFTLWSVLDAGIFFWESLGQGKAYKEVLRPLSDATRAVMEGCHCPVVWAIHFPPDFPHIDSALELLDGHGVLLTAAELNVHHVFCGHTHQPFQYTIDVQNGRAVTVYCAGTATQYCAPAEDGGNTVHPVEIETDDGQVTAVRWYTLRWWTKGGGFRVLRAKHTNDYVSPGRTRPFRGVATGPREWTFSQRLIVSPPIGIWPTWETLSI